MKYFRRKYDDEDKWEKITEAEVRRVAEKNEVGDIDKLINDLELGLLWRSPAALYQRYIPEQAVKEKEVLDDFSSKIKV